MANAKATTSQKGYVVARSLVSFVNTLTAQAKSDILRQVVIEKLGNNAATFIGDLDIKYKLYCLQKKVKTLHLEVETEASFGQREGCVLIRHFHYTWITVTMQAPMSANLQLPLNGV